MDSDNLLMVIAVIAVVVAVVAAGFTYMTIGNISKTLTGYVSEGNVSIYIESAADFNFSKAAISFGSGKVSQGSSSASLVSLDTNNNVSGGNWSLLTSGGFQIENTGNVNLTFNISAGKSAATFIGGSSPGYYWNISNIEANSCLNESGYQTVTSNRWASTSTAPATICSPLQFLAGSDTIRIDINLTIPENSLTGSLSDLITGYGWSTY